MANKDENFDYDEMRSDPELREQKETGSYGWIIWVIVLIIIVAGAFFIFSGDSNNQLIDWGTPEENIPEETGKSVTIDEMDLVARESFPVQIAAQVRGTLSDPCTEVSDISQLRDGNTFYVDIKAGEKVNCEVGGELAPVEYADSIELETIGLPAGEYQVDVNGMTDSFVLAVDNEIDMSAGEQK